MMNTKSFEWVPNSRAYVAYKSDLCIAEPSFRKILNDKFENGIYLIGTKKQRCFFEYDHQELEDDEIICWVLKAKSSIGKGSFVKIYNS